jgi:hypothetical protein
MRQIGFSTGALAKGDFGHGLKLLAKHECPAVELSALRDHELKALMEGAPDLDLGAFSYVSVHAPSRFVQLGEAEVAELLRPCIERRWPIILHPDAIEDHGCWSDFGELLCIENMDQRKSSGRTVGELEPHFEALPKAGLCLDLGHARHVDPTMTVAREILRSFGDRVTQLHLSELDARARHRPLSMATVWAVSEISNRIPDAPVILESVITEDQITKELVMARRCFEAQPKHRPEPPQAQI